VFAVPIALSVDEVRIELAHLKLHANGAGRIHNCNGNY
jgi:hypothetical protein